MSTGTTPRRVEPTAALIPAQGQPRLAYVNASNTDIRKRFAQATAAAKVLITAGALK